MDKVRQREIQNQINKGAVAITFGSPHNAWLRSPNPSNANNVRNVNASTGAINNNNANNANGAAPDCEKCPFQVVSKETKAARLTQGATVPTRKGKHYG